MGTSGIGYFSFVNEKTHKSYQYLDCMTDYECIVAFDMLIDRFLKNALNPQGVTTA